MAELPEATGSRIGMEIRCNHPYAFHSGEWGEITGLVHHERGLDTAGDPILRWCYTVIFPNGDTDVWTIDDPEAAYQFRGEPLTFTQGPEELEALSLDSQYNLKFADHAWTLKHQMRKSGLEMPGKVRAVCKCGWETAAVYPDGPAAIERWRAHYEAVTGRELSD